MAPAALSDLYYNLKRDPETYRADFERYYENYQALEQSFTCAPSQCIEKLKDLLLFLSQVVNFYPNFTECFCNSVMHTLISRSFGMHPVMRQAFMKALMRLRTKDLIPADRCIDVAFRLHRCQDKEVRLTMRNFVVYDIKRINRRQKANKLNSTIQLYLSKTLKDNNPTVAREAVFVLVRLFKKNVWNDARTANLLADACLAKRKKVYSPAVRFFLGQDKVPEWKDSDSDSESDTQNKETKIKQLRLGHRVGTKTNRRTKRLKRSIEHVNKAEERKAAKGNNMANFVAISLLHDPQAFAERLFKKLERCTDRFEIRLFILDLVTRLIGLHKLLVLNLYPFIQRFLKPHQREVTRLLLFTAQASHDEVPPDVMEPVLRTIADNFITERASSEAIAVGLNAVREICARCPYAISPDLLSDLIGYRTYKNKNVVAAARSLIRLYRGINPTVLPRKERGRPTEAQLEIFCDPALASSGISINYGQPSASRFVPGSEALVLAKAMAKKSKKDHPKLTSNKREVVATDLAKKHESMDSMDEHRICSEKDGAGSHECSSEEDSDEEVSSGVDMDGGGTCADSDGSVNSDLDESRANLSDSKNDDGWVDVPHSSDEEKTIFNIKVDPSTLASEALEVASSRIFTQEEFEVMRKYQQTKQKRFASLGSGTKRKADQLESFEVDSDEDEGANEGLKSQLVSLSAITRLVKRPRQSKAERLEAVEEGRAGREKYGYKVNRMNPHASTTNREKSKRKAFQMIKHKVKQKAKRSFRDKQIALRDRLRHMMKHMH